MKILSLVVLSCVGLLFSSRPLLAFQFDIKSPSTSATGFGSQLLLLPNGNFLVFEGVATQFPSTAPTKAHLYNASGVLISTSKLLSNGFEHGKATLLANGNVVVDSWSTTNDGAVTLIN